jgi:hypothetical protein
MSEEYTIHVRPKGDARAIDFVHDAEAAIGAQFSPDTGGDGLVAMTSTKIVYAYVEGVDLEDDGDVPFSRYPWYLEQIPMKTEEARQATLEHMRSIYGALVATGRYGCCLVHSLSTLLANNDGLTSRAASG